MRLRLTPMHRRPGRGFGRGVMVLGCAAAWAAGLVACGGGSGSGGLGKKGEGGGRFAAKEVIGGLGDSPGRFVAPRAIDADERSVWVIDKTARVQRLDARTGACLALWTMPEWEKGKPVGVTVAPSPEGGRLYVADTHYSRVMVYAAPEDASDALKSVTPRLVMSFGAFGEGPGEFIYPTDVAVLMGGDGETAERIYVGEYGGNDRVSVFDGSGEFLFSFGRYGTGEDPGAVEFDRPQSLAFDPGTGELLIVDARNHRIGRFTREGELIGWIGRHGRGPGELNYPWSIVPLGDGTALVAEVGNNRVQRIDLVTGEGIATYGRPGREEGELASPWAIAMVGKRAFVVDMGNNRVQAFDGPRAPSAPSGYGALGAGGLAGGGR